MLNSQLLIYEPVLKETFGLFAPKYLNYKAFQAFVYEHTLHLMKIIPETPRMHQIIYSEGCTFLLTILVYFKA
jgi:hypothetical protein